MTPQWPSFWANIPEDDRPALREILADLLTTGVLSCLVALVCLATAALRALAASLRVLLLAVPSFVATVWGLIALPRLFGRTVFVWICHLVTSCIPAFRDQKP